MEVSTQEKRFPITILLVIIALAAIEPLTHAWIYYATPDGAVPTGAHTGDSAHHILCMRSFENGLHSPFATTKAADGPHSFRYFAAPLFLLYGLVGEVGRLLHVHEFLFLGIANGLGVAFLLLMTYRFLRDVFPRLATHAFFLYALGGGLGGILFLITGLFGTHTSPAFDTMFQRFAWYELIEGPHLSPVLLMARLYYTLPLGLAVAALTALIQADRIRCAKKAAFSCLLLFAATFLNMRVGPMVWLVVLLYLLSAATGKRTQRVRLALAVSAAVFFGVAASWILLRAHPSYRENVVDVTVAVMRIIPFLSATIFLWIAVAPRILPTIQSLPAALRMFANAAVGYLSVYLILYALYQAYWGNWLVGGDTSAAIAVSDASLLGVPLAIYAAHLWRRKSNLEGSPPSPELQWTLLWMFLFLTMAVAALGHGTFLRFAPQRLMIFLGLPIAILAAEGLTHLPPLRRFALYTTIIACGITSTGVAALYFQGPLGRIPGQGPFAYLHYETMTENDASLLEQLPDGNIVVPPWSPIAFGEIVALQPGKQVLGGPGAMNLGDQNFGTLQRAVNTFFDPNTPDKVRRSFAHEWQIDYVYCPDTCPIQPETLAAFRATPWLKEAAWVGKGRIFLVALE